MRGRGWREVEHGFTYAEVVTAVTVLGIVFSVVFSLVAQMDEQKGEQFARLEGLRIARDTLERWKEGDLPPVPYSLQRNGIVYEVMLTENVEGDRVFRGEVTVRWRFREKWRDVSLTSLKFQ
ncbi:hypothetical protein BSNK01_06160 [Bacillaceae bacterium]